MAILIGNAYLSHNSLERPLPIRNIHHLRLQAEGDEVQISLSIHELEKIEAEAEELGNAIESADIANYGEASLLEDRLDRLDLLEARVRASLKTLQGSRLRIVS